MVNSLDVRFRGYRRYTDYSRHFQTSKPIKRDTLRKASIDNSIDQWLLTATHLFGHDVIDCYRHASMIYQVGNHRTAASR